MRSFLRKIDNLDSYGRKISAFRLCASSQPDDNKAPMHTHKQGQLVMPINGMMTCRVSDAIWLVPKHHAVWIPAHIPHTNTPSKGAEFCFVYIDDSRQEMPHSCRTLSISPMLKEMLIYLSELPPEIKPDENLEKLIDVAFFQLVQMPAEKLSFPLPSEKRLKKIADALITTPSDRRTAEEWACDNAMSVRTFTRLVKSQTGMSFRDWRRQLHIIVALQRLSEHWSIQAVSDELGYDSVSAFITMFKKELGKPPRQYLIENINK